MDFNPVFALCKLYNVKKSPAALYSTVWSDCFVFGELIQIYKGEWPAAGGKKRYSTLYYSAEMIKIAPKARFFLEPNLVQYTQVPDPPLVFEQI